MFSIPSQKPKVSNSFVRLGEKIVRQLERTAEVDFLARWMSHYLAELITAAKEGSGDAGASTQHAAAQLILQLWEHCDTLPGRSRAFRNYDAAYRVLESIDPKSAKPRFYQITEPDNEPDAAANNPWLLAMRALDQSTRVLMQHCLDRYMADAPAEDQEWLSLSDQAGLPNTAASALFEQLMAGRRRAQGDVYDESAERRKSLINALTILTEVADAIRSSLDEKATASKPIDQSRKPAITRKKKNTSRQK